MLNFTKIHQPEFGDSFVPFEAERPVDIQKICIFTFFFSKLDSLENDTQIDDRKTTGDASESAILKLMEKLFGNVEEKRKLSPKVRVLKK